MIWSAISFACFLITLALGIWLDDKLCLFVSGFNFCAFLDVFLRPRAQA